MLLGHLPVSTLPLGVLDPEYEYERRVDEDTGPGRTLIVPRQDRTLNAERTTD